MDKMLKRPEVGQINDFEGLRLHMLKTYSWMFLGVAITFSIAFILGSNRSLMELIFEESMLPMIFIFAQFGVVIALAARITKMKTSTAKVLFIAYSILTGCTFSVLIVAYTSTSIIMAYAISCLFFGSLSLIGYTTKLDLSKLGTICIGALFAMIIFQVLAMLFGWGYDVMLVSIIGLLIFTGLTAWDVQKAKQMYYQYQDNPDMIEKISIYSAFDLYLDFINIFLYILRILGKAKD